MPARNDASTRERGWRAAAVAGKAARCRGFVLVAVIWLCALLAAFAIAVSLSVRSHALYVRNAISGSLAQGVADGLVRITALRLADGGSVLAGQPSDGRWQACRWPGIARAWLSVQNQAGLVDLNTAPTGLLVALFSGLGLARPEAVALAAALQDYRDADHLAQQGGAEPAAYPGRAHGPKNAPFEAVEELDQLPGIPPALLARLLPLVTVATQQAGIDVSLAPAALLQALGMSRRAGQGAFSISATSRVSAVSAAVELADGTRVLRRAMIERVDQPGLPFVVTAWEAGAWPAPRAPPGAAARPCLAR